MSTTAESERAVSSGNQTTSPETATPRKPLGLWLPTLVLLGYWIVDEGGRQIDLGMFQRFSSRFIALLALILFFLVWGFTRRHFTLRQRLAGFAIIVGLMIVAGLAADP